ncbi:MAG: hypothetical protein ACQEXX_19825 [Bacillota bacterium]
MNAVESKQDTELIEIVMNCGLDFNDRKHAAVEVIKRLGLEESAQAWIANDCEEEPPRKITPLTLAERAYLARYAKIDGYKTVAYALGRSHKSVEFIGYKMRKTGEWDLYQSLTHEEYENLVLASERSEQHEKVV